MGRSCRSDSRIIQKQGRVTPSSNVRFCSQRDLLLQSGEMTRGARKRRTALHGAANRSQRPLKWLKRGGCRATR